jgi:hypothetical protein
MYLIALSGRRGTLFHGLRFSYVHLGCTVYYNSGCLVIL